MIGNKNNGINQVVLNPAQARRISVLILDFLDGSMDIQEPDYSNDIWVHFENQRGQQTYAVLIDENGNIKRLHRNNLAF